MAIAQIRVERSRGEIPQTMGIVCFFHLLI